MKSINAIEAVTACGNLSITEQEYAEIVAFGIFRAQNSFVMTCVGDYYNNGRPVK